MFARVKLFTREAQEALVLPEQALVPQGEDQYVYRVVDGKSLRTKVEVGQRRDSRVEILKGVAPGDTIVVAGQLKIRDGTSVTFAPSATAAPKAAAAASAQTSPPVAAQTLAPAKASAQTSAPAKAESNVPPPPPKS
jgi:membrane fusion protein (multidrug efflux system)